MDSLSVGIDFDNTIVSYEGVFYSAALEKELIPPDLPPFKGAIRDYLRAADKEELWTELQGYIYGAKMDTAFPYPGVESFFLLCSRKKIPTYIISHKTKQPFLGYSYDLHQSARDWLEKNAFTSPAFFELTLQAKLNRIRQQGCTVFIDDLPEVLKNPLFPKGVRKILFDPHNLYSPSEDFEYANHWNDILEILQIFTYET